MKSSAKTLNITWRKHKRYARDPNKVELDSDITHEFSSIKIGSGCTLTVQPWLGRDTFKQQESTEIQLSHLIDSHSLSHLIASWSDHNILHISKHVRHLILTYLSSVFTTSYAGGKLLIQCKGDVIIEKGGKICVDSCGYTSGTYYTSGESYNDTGMFEDITSNIGGGGAGLMSCGGGGGGYATVGASGICSTEAEGTDKQHKQVGEGGHVYGDKYLNVLHLGSGGGGSECNLGGDGGGAIAIECQNLVNYGSITANGGNAATGAGAGSGGSIHLVVHGTIIMDKDRDSKIETRGGLGGKWGLYGNGGHGRIRIDIDKKHHDQMERITRLKAIHPVPYVAEM